MKLSLLGLLILGMSSFSFAADLNASIPKAPAQQSVNNISYVGQDISRVPPIVADANQPVWSNDGNLIG